MKKILVLLVVAIFLGGFSAFPAAADNLLNFKGGIGVIPISNVVVDNTGAVTAVNRNIVRGVNSPGQIWAIRDLEASIKTDGEIKVEGKGLILAGGNNVGRATGQSVFASLFCETAEHSTSATGVPLADNGNFKIHDVLTPPPPADCENPVLLIRTAGSGNWFAAGIPKGGSD
jgi:hypothetical protein